MGRTRVTCEYCHKSFENSHEARQRHTRGRNHKANVKLWYDRFADQERPGAAATPRQTGRPSSQQSFAPLNQEPLGLQNLPPSMYPAPPTAFYSCWADWG